jgi:signal transduction histidine kinase
MELNDVLPILIPGVLMQISMQLFYIRRCIRDRELSTLGRMLFCVAIAVFNLPAAACYLLMKKDPQADADEVLKRENTPDNIQQGIFLLLIVAYEVLALHLLAGNDALPAFGFLTALLATIFIMLLAGNLTRMLARRTVFLLTNLLLMVLSVMVVYLDATNEAVFIMLLVGMGILNQVPLRQMKPYTVGIFGFHLLAGTARNIRVYGSVPFDEVVRIFYVGSILFLFALAAMYALKKLLIANAHLKAALKKLAFQSEELRRMAVFEERNRISAEMHDLVGHTLTGAILSLESLETLTSDRDGRIREKVAKANELVRKGLETLRAWVRTEHADNPVDFSREVVRLLDEIRETLGLPVNCVYETPVAPTSHQAGVLLHAIRECATNAIRHGQATEADMLLQEQHGQLRLTFSDNGTGAGSIVSGSGLRIMRDRIERLGGTLSVYSDEGEGVTVDLTLPVQEKTQMVASKTTNDLRETSDEVAEYRMPSDR